MSVKSRRKRGKKSSVKEKEENETSVITITDPEKFADELLSQELGEGEITVEPIVLEEKTTEEKKSEVKPIVPSTDVVEPEELAKAMLETEGKEKVEIKGVEITPSGVKIEEIKAKETDTGVVVEEKEKIIVSKEEKGEKKEKKRRGRKKKEEKKEEKTKEKSATEEIIIPVEIKGKPSEVKEEIVVEEKVEEKEEIEKALTPKQEASLNDVMKLLKEAKENKIDIDEFNKKLRELTKKYGAQFVQPDELVDYLFEKIKEGYRVFVPKVSVDVVVRDNKLETFKVRVNNRPIDEITTKYVFQLGTYVNAGIYSDRDSKNARFLIMSEAWMEYDKDNDMLYIVKRPEAFNSLKYGMRIRMEIPGYKPSRRRKTVSRRRRVRTTVRDLVKEVKSISKEDEEKLKKMLEEKGIYIE